MILLEMRKARLCVRTWSAEGLHLTGNANGGKLVMINRASEHIKLTLFVVSTWTSMNDLIAACSLDARSYEASHMPED